MTSRQNPSARRHGAAPDQIRAHRSQPKTDRAQPILLDRLAAALATHKVSLKRTALQSVAAAAFGYRNGHEFAVADLVPPKAIVLGHALSAEQTFVVLRDPLAGESYAIPAAQLPKDDAARADAYGLSPYGHLLDLTGLQAGNAEPEDPHASLHAATFIGPAGIVTFGGKTRADLNRSIANHCRMLAKRHGLIISGEDDIMLAKRHELTLSPEDDIDAISGYLAQVDDVQIDYRDLSGAIPAQQPAAPLTDVIVWTGYHSYEDGGSSYAAFSEAELYAKIADAIEPVWSEVEHAAGPVEDYPDPKDLVEAYFEHSDEDTLDVCAHPLTRTGADASPASSDSATATWEDQVAEVRRQVEAADPGDHWAQHPLHDTEAWQEAVANGDTREGYWAWLAKTLEESGAEDVDDPAVYFAEAPTSAELGEDKQPDSVYLRKDWEAGYQIGLHHLPYGEWLDDQIGRNCAMRERWLTPQTLKSLQAENVIGDTWDAVLRVPLVEVTNEGTRVTARPGTVVRVIGHQVRGDTRVTILLDHNVSVTLRPEERSGFIPLTVANQMPAQAGGVEHPLYTHADWKAEAARGARSVSYRQWLKEREDLDVRRRETWFRGTDFRNLRGKHDFTVHIHGNAVLENRPGKIGETVTFAPGDVVALESAEFSGAVGHVVLKTREGGLFTLKTRDAAGTLPISLIIPQHQRDRAIHPREDWMAAMKATGAQGVYQAWFQSVIGSEIRDGWLSEADAQTLKPGDRVTMQVYGDTDPHDPQGESYTLDYAPGTHVTFLTRFPKEGVIRYTFKTSEGGVFSMSPSERGGFLPISRYVSVDPDFDAWIQEVETLLSQSVSPDEWKAYYHLGYAPVNAVSAYRTATRNAP